MGSDYKASLSEAHPETMDLLSRAWIDFAVHEVFQNDRALVLQDNNSINISDYHTKTPYVVESKDEGGTKMICGKNVEKITEKSIPIWKSNDVQSWIWMQQAMHPELNYHSFFPKKWLNWKSIPLRHASIKKWWNEMKQKRKEDKRLRKADVHAAISVAKLAVTLAAITADNTKHDEPNTVTKESALASATALVAAHCTKVAEAMGAKREQLTSVMSSSMSDTNASDILTLTAAATTSLKGAATLKARKGCRNRINRGAPVLLTEESDGTDFDIDKCRLILAKGSELIVETPYGNRTVRSVSVVLSHEAMVILKTRKPNSLNAFAGKKESIILDLHAELYKPSEADVRNTGYLIVLRTNQGTIKLDMENDYENYITWAMTINHMMILSNSITNYELQFY